MILTLLLECCNVNSYIARSLTIRNKTHKKKIENFRKFEKSSFYHELFHFYMEFHRNRIILKKGEDVNGYKIVSLLGQGGYGEVYKVTNSNGQKYAMKTEYFTSPKKTIEYETEVIKKLRDPYFPKVYADGKTEDFVYLIIDVLGPSISDIERTKYDEITNEFTLNFAIQSLFAIEKFHENGYVHRDIKPGNFFLKRSQISIEFDGFWN